MKFSEEIFYRSYITKYNYKKLSIFPLILGLLSFIVVSALGINLGVELRSGTLATVQQG